VALDHVAHRERAAVVTHLQRFGLPGAHGLGAHGLHRPHQVEPGARLRARAGRLGGQAQLQALDAVLAAQPPGQVQQGLDQRVAVHLEPQRGVHLAGQHARVQLLLQAARRRGHQVGAQHVFQRPARLELAQALVGGLVQAPRQGADLVADHTQEALARGGVEAGVVEQFHRRLQVAQAAALAFGDTVQQLVTRGVLGQVARDVVQHQHEAIERVFGPGLGGAHRRHLHAQQLAAARGGDELRRRVGGTALQPLLHGFQCVRHQTAVEHAVDAAAQAQRLGPADGRAGTFAVHQGAELQPRARVEQQHAAVQVAHHHALRQLGHQRRQAVALLLDAAAGLGHLGRDVGAQRVTLRHQRVDGAGQRAAAGAALGFGQRAPGVGGQQHLQLLGDTAGRGAVLQPLPARQRAGSDAGHQPQQEHQRHARLQQRPRGGALRWLQRGRQQARCAA
jgi:hypothetical protein